MSFYDVREQNSVGCIAAVIVFFAAVAALLYFSAYTVLLVALGTLAGGGLLAGLVYALIVYVRGLRGAVGACASPDDDRIGQFLRAWLRLFPYAVRSAWACIIGAVRDMWGRFRGHTALLSFRKWAWFAAIPFVFLGAVCMTLVVTGVQLLLFAVVLAAILALGAVVFAILVTIGVLFVVLIGLAIEGGAGKEIDIRLDRFFDFSKCANMGTLKKKTRNFLVDMRVFPKEMTETHMLALDDHFRYPSSRHVVLYTLQGILYLGAAVGLFLNGCWLTVLLGIVLSALYLIGWLFNLFWVVILSIIRRFRRR